jgi:thiamine transport system substrate-binding protein
MTHESWAVSEEVLASFEAETGARVEFLKSGDAGLVVNQAILARERPLADVLFGVDNTLLSRALDADLFEPYASPLLEGIPDEFEHDPEHRVTPVDYGDVCLNYDKEAFEERDLAVPHTLEDLTRPEYAGLLAVQDPSTSSPGLAFMLATIARYGESGSRTWLDFWADLRRNDVEVLAGWEEAYYGSFSGGSGEGDRPLVVSYASSPPAEVVFADPQPTEAPTGVIEDGCFRQVEFAGVLRGTDDAPLAQEFIDFLLSRPFQEDLPLQMFVFPVDPEATLPEVFQRWAAVPTDPLSLDPAVIGRERERWIEEWTRTVLR